MISYIRGVGENISLIIGKVTKKEYVEDLLMITDHPVEAVTSSDKASKLLERFLKKIMLYPSSKHII